MPLQTSEFLQERSCASPSAKRIEKVTKYVIDFTLLVKSPHENHCHITTLLPLKNVTLHAFKALALSAHTLRVQLSVYSVSDCWRSDTRLDHT